MVIGGRSRGRLRRGEVLPAGRIENWVLKIGFWKMGNDSEKARKRLYAAQRPDYARWYTKPRWRKLRASVLSSEPFCKKCRAKSTEVDHIIPHKGNYGLFYSRNNLQALCKSCHSRKTALESDFARGGKDKTLAICGEDGIPTDPNHPWNK